MYYGPDGPHSITDPTPTPTPTQTTTTQTQTQTGPTSIPDTVQQRIEYEKQKAQEAIKRQQEQNIKTAKTTAEENSSQRTGPTSNPVTKEELESDPNYWANKRDSATTFNVQQLTQELNNTKNSLRWNPNNQALLSKVDAIEKALEMLNEKQGEVPSDIDIDGGETKTEFWTDLKEKKGSGPSGENQDTSTPTETNTQTPMGPSSYTNPWALDPEKELETQKKHVEEMEKKRQGDVVPAPQPSPQPEPEPTPQPSPQPEPQTEPETKPEPEIKWDNKFTNPEEKTYDQEAITDRTPAQAKPGMYDNLYLIGSGNYQGNNGPNGIPNNANPNLYAINYKSLFPNIN